MKKVNVFFLGLLLVLCMCSVRAQTVSYPYGLIDIGDGELDLGAFNYCRGNKPTRVAPLVIEALENQDASLLLSIAPNALSLSSQVVLQTAIANSTPSILDIPIPECFEELVYHPLFDLLTNSVLRPGIENVVILVHGWNPSDNANQYAEGPFLDLTVNLVQALIGTGWGLVQYHWEENAATGQIYNNMFGPGKLFNSPIEAASIADSHGRYLAQQLLASHPNLKRVMLLCHSAGSWIGYRTTKILLDQNSEVQVEPIFMDPFVPGEIVAVNSPLDKARMSSLSNFGGERVFLHNYAGDDGFDAFAACAGSLSPADWGDLFTYGTYTTFAWDSRHIQVALNEAYLLLGGLNVCRYGGHAGAIKFVADSVGAYIKETYPNAPSTSYSLSSEWQPEWNGRYAFQQTLFVKQQREKEEQLRNAISDALNIGGEVIGSTVYINGKAYDMEPQGSYNMMQMCIPNHKGFESQYGSTGLNLTENEFTIEGWWKPLGIPGYTTFMEKLKRHSDGKNIGWCFELVHGRDLCFWYEAAGQEMTRFVSRDAVSFCDANTPMHLYVSVNQADQTAVMYKNGEPLPVERQYAGSSHIECDPNVPFRFGASAAYPWREFHGTVRDWHIWEGQKSIEWIKAQEWFPGWHGGCIASWTFCKKDIENGWLDDSSRGNHLTTAGYQAEMSLGDLSLAVWNQLRADTWGINPCTLPPMTFEGGMLYHYPGTLTIGYDIGNTITDIQTLPILNTREFTISLWAQVPAIGEQSIFSAQEYGGEGSNIVVGVSGAGEICGSFLWGPSRASSGLCPRYAAIADNQWKHIVYRYYEVDGYPVSDIFVNGVLIGDMHRPTFAPYAPRGTPYYVMLGGRVDQGYKVRAFGGSLADVRVYPTKKSEIEINELYTNGF